MSQLSLSFTMHPGALNYMNASAATVIRRQCHHSNLFRLHGFAALELQETVNDIALQLR